MSVIINAVCWASKKCLLTRNFTVSDTLALSFASVAVGCRMLCRNIQQHCRNSAVSEDLSFL